MNSSGPVYKIHENSIDYQDGSEKLLLDIVSKPDFDESTSWQAGRDWAIYYHLSPQRKNILNWMDFGSEPVDVLELGAGCGAITSGLVEFPNARVVALEGSRHRADVICARCKTFSNLEVHVSNINTFQPDRKFDLVTLIGVLEYSGKYGQGVDPFQELLNRVSQWLKEDGCVAVAIENKLGHKYLAGFPEDHYGKPYEGINGYPNYDGAATFTSIDLKTMLEKAGLRNQHWFFPYPDYKLPAVILSDAVLLNSEFDSLGLLRVTPEPNSAMNPSFNENAFLGDLLKLGTAAPFMNSFLVFAAARERNCFSRNNGQLLAVRENNKQRHKSFRVTTRFESEGQGISVVKKGGKKFTSDFINRREPVHWREYKTNRINFQDLLLDLLYRGTESALRTEIERWTSLLNSHRIQPAQDQISRYESFCSGVLGRKLYAASQEWVSGEIFDLIPKNILFDCNEKCLESVDLEWDITFPLPLQFLFDRGWNYLSHEILRLTPFWRREIDPKLGLPRDVQLALDKLLPFRMMNLQDCRAFEKWFHAGLEHGLFGDSKSLIPPLDLGSFLRNTARFARTDPKMAFAYYQSHRSCFEQSPQLAEFDQLMQRLSS